MERYIDHSTLPEADTTHGVDQRSLPAATDVPRGKAIVTLSVESKRCLTARGLMRYFSHLHERRWKDVRKRLSGVYLALQCPNSIACLRRHAIMEEPRYDYPWFASKLILPDKSRFKRVRVIFTWREITNLSALII